MIAQIQNINDSTFTINGVPFYKIFIAIPSGNGVRIVCVYDSRLEILSPTNYTNVTVDGNDYNSVSELIGAIKGVVYNAKFEDSSTEQFSETQADRLKELVYENAIQAISVSPTSFEKGVATNLTFTWKVVKNDDTLTSVTLDGNNVTADADGTNKQYQVANAMTSKSVALQTVLDRNGTAVNLNNTKTAPAYTPQYIGKMTTAEPIGTYVGLAAHTKKVQSSSNLTANSALNDEYLFFISTSASKTPKDNLTGFSLSIGNWDDGTAFMIKKTFTTTLANGDTQDITLYRTREKKTQTLNISLV